MKRAYVTVFVFIILCLLADSGIKNSIAEQIDNRSPYYLSFASIGANLLESRLDSWAKINTAEDFNDMERDLYELLELLDLPVKITSITYKQEQETRIISYQISQGQIDYLITLQSYDHSTHFILTAISRQGDLALRHKATLLKQHYQAKTYFQYKGIIYASPDQDGQIKIVNVICKCLQAKEIDTYKSENMVSMAAFSPLLSNQYEDVKLAGKTYNLQMAIHNDSNKNQSYVYLGIPLLLNDY